MHPRSLVAGRWLFPEPAPISYHQSRHPNAWAVPWSQSECYRLRQAVLRSPSDLIAKNRGTCEPPSVHSRSLPVRVSPWDENRRLGTRSCHSAPLPALPALPTGPRSGRVGRTAPRRLREFFRQPEAHATFVAEHSRSSTCAPPVRRLDADCCISQKAWSVELETRN